MKEEAASKTMRSLESGYGLPALSVVAVKLVEMASDETCSAHDLAGLIEKDPSLSVRLLKLANSAFFQTTKPVVTLKQAIVRVGFHYLRIMALSISLRETFPMGKEGPMDYERFWRTSIYRALLAKSFARETKSCNPEEAFVSALVLEVGLLVFFDLFLKGKNKDFDLELEPLEKLLASERDLCGIDHRAIGETALRYWKFPEDIVGCQTFYGGVTKTKETSPLARVCEQARQCSADLFQKSIGLHEIFEETERSLVLGQEVISDILVSTFDQVQAIADSLLVDLDGDKDLLEVMEKANSALIQISEQIREDHPLVQNNNFSSLEELIEEGNKEGIVSHTLQVVAHEIRNPLVAVGGFARKLASTIDPSTEGGRYVQIILQEALRLERALAEMISQDNNANH
jgi:HD-like signal output (HDOD) protein